MVLEVHPVLFLDAGDDAPPELAIKRSLATRAQPLPAGAVIAETLQRQVHEFTDATDVRVIAEQHAQQRGP